MKKLLFFCLLACLVTGLSAKVKVTFTAQWGELGLCSKLPISLDNYKGFRLEFAEAAPANLQLKIQNATDEADTNNYPAQYEEVEKGASQIAIDFNTEHFGSDRKITVLNIQAKEANVVVVLKRMVLIKTDGTEEECSYDANAGWNRTVEEISDDTPSGGDTPSSSTKLKVTFTDQWGELGLCSKLPISLDNYKGFRLEFAEAAPANLQLKIQNATDEADTNNYPAQYEEVEKGASQIAIDFNTEHFGSDRKITVLNIQAKEANVVVVLKRMVLIKTDGTEEECSYDANAGWNRTVEEISDDTPSGGDTPSSSTKLKVTFTDQWGELGLCSKLPISLDNYKGFRLEFAEAAPANLQLKIQNATDEADTNNYPAQYEEVEKGASQIAIDFNTEHFGSDRKITVLNIQAKEANVVVVLKRMVLIKTDGTEEECSYDAKAGWNRTVEEISDDTPSGGGDDPTPGVDTGTSDKIEAETMTPGGQYAGVCSSPFAGMAFYGNGDCATKTVTFPVKNGMYTVGVRGASSNNSGAGIALYVNGKKISDFTFYVTQADTKYADCKVLLGNATTAEVKLNLETDNGSNDTYVDYITFTLQNEMQERTAPVLPSQGAYYTNTYRNLFVEAGYSETKVNQKLEQAWQQLFEGTDGREDGQRVYYEVGTDEAYILDVNNDDVRSEGQSYGMMICVQMDKQTEFNKLWKWAKTHMQHEDGEFKGYFAWVMNKDGSKRESSPAPDGEEYFITSLMLAANRWGNGTGIYDYMAEANAILETSWGKPDPNFPFSDVKPLFDKTEKQVVFVPYATSATKTDPSYHLPAFYRLWAEWADNHQDFYTQLAEKSHEMFPKFAHATTGLMPDYANFDGTPNGEGGHNNFRFDAWRCMMNMGCDYAWFADCSDEVTLVKRAHDFFYSKGVKEYYSNYTLDGNTDSGNSDHSAGLVACNAVAALASNDIKAWDFVDDLWDTPIPSGRYRYYDGMLYFMGFLHASGNFRIYKPDGGGTTSLPQPLQREGSLAGAWFDLSGRKLSGKPTRKGIYVYNGKKRVIK